MRRRLLIFILLATTFAARPVTAQQRTDTSAAAVDTTRLGVKPGTAFLRSVLVPGWGQLSVHANRRAAIFIALQSTSWYMLVKTLNKLSDAQHIEDDSVRIAGDSVRVLMAKDTALNRIYSDAARFNARVDSASSVIGIRKLVRARTEQRQDWITYTVFLTLASGVDAFVAAHLADFPATISTRRRPNGAYQVKLTVPFPHRP